MERPDEKFLEQATSLIKQLRSGLLSESEISAAVERLHSLLPDPHFMGYTIDHVPELSPEDVVRRAFQYRPITL